MTSQQSTLKRNVARWHDCQASFVEDELVVEEPIEIRVGGKSLVVVMRTPGQDFELAAGFLYTEGIVNSVHDIGTIAYCEDVEQVDLQNIINVNLTNGWDAESEDGWQRNFHANASCGLCGKMTIEVVQRAIPPIESQLQIDPEIVYTLSDLLRSAQSVFEVTGGLHAAGLFTAGGELLIVREDIGRHNAVDKVIGQALLAEMFPLDNHVLMVSGRASFEIVQKALFARIPVVVAVSAGSTLAVDLAQESRMALIGFTRGNRMTVYSCPERIQQSASKNGNNLVA